MLKKTGREEKNKNPYQRWSCWPVGEGNLEAKEAVWRMIGLCLLWIVAYLEGAKFQ